MTFEVRRRPNWDWTEILAGGLVYIGFLIFLVILHIWSITEAGNTQAVLTEVYVVFLYIYIAAIIFGMVAVVWKLLKWLTWSINMPTWKKEKIRRGEL